MVIADYQLNQGENGSRARRDIQRRWGEGIPGLLLTVDVEPGRLKEATESGFKVIQKLIQPDKLREEVTERIESTDPVSDDTDPKRIPG